MNRNADAPAADQRRTLIEDPVLSNDVLELWGRATELLHGNVEQPPLPRDFATASAMLKEAGESLLRTVAAPDGDGRDSAASLLAALSRLSDQLAQARMARRGRDLTLVREALGRLRALRTREELLFAAPAELCACGFDRAMVTRVDGSDWRLVSVHDGLAADRGRGLLASMRSRTFQLHQLAGAREMIRLGVPVLELAAQDQEGPLAELMRRLGVQSYVASPIIPETTPIGLVYAERSSAGTPLDESDRDLVWAFAEGLGHSYERVTLLDRITALRGEMRRLSSALAVMMDESAGREIEFTSGQGFQLSSEVSGPQADPAALLTRRERDVMKRLALGETNAEIAAELFVSEGTVKSHVKHILRKLRAGNRAEAVSRYVELARRSARDEIVQAANWPGLANPGRD